jgi:hypothetical protein
VEEGETEREAGIQHETTAVLGHDRFAGRQLEEEPLYAPETTVTEEGAAGAKAALGVQAECPSVPIAESDLGESVRRDGNTAGSTTRLVTGEDLYTQLSPDSVSAMRAMIQQVRTV